MCILIRFARTGLVMVSLAVALGGWLPESPAESTASAATHKPIVNREGAAMSQSDFKLNKIAVVMLGVKDLPKSVAFYRDTLGLEPQGEVPGEFAFFNAGGTMLALSVPLADPKATPNTVGALEVVFGVEDVTAGYNALRARGVTFIREPRNVTGANWSAVFTDPDGHRLSIFGPKLT